MNYYKAKISYKGTRFSGWQKQLDQKTIQGELEKVVVKISNSNDIKVIGSGRTDAGVHALGQIVRISTPLEIEPISFSKGINSLIDSDIKIMSLECCSESFQPAYDVKIKEYRYYFSTDKNINPLYQESIVFLNKNLDLDKMNLACSKFVGVKDFVNFYTVGTDVKSTIREIFQCEVRKIESDFLNFPNETYEFIISGSGFLKQMVRLVIASIWACGESKITEDEIRDYLTTKKTTKLAPTAAAHGLYLYSVVY